MSEYTAGQLADRAVSVLPAGTSFDEQMRELAHSGHTFAVVVNQHQFPTTLTTLDRVAAALVVAPETPLDSLITGPRVASLLHEDGIPGVVVVGEAGVVGVVPAQLIQQYVQARRNRFTRGGTPSDSGGAFQGLPGRSLGSYEPLRLRCATCGHVNERETFYRGVDQCDNGHLLVVDR